MKIKVESAKDSGRSFNGQNGVVNVYEAVVLITKDDGSVETKVVDCMTKRVMDYIGREVPGATTTPNKNPNYHDKLNIPKEEGFATGGGGFNKSYKSYGKSKDEMVLTAKTMIWSFLKDAAIKDMEVNKGTFEKAVLNVISAFPKAIATLDLDKLPDAPKQPSPAPTAPVSTLRAPLITILKKNMANRKFRAQDMVEYAAACGIELKWDVSNDEVVWICSEEEATKLINDMAEGNIPF